MPSSWSPSPEPTVPPRAPEVVRRFVEASRRAEIVALVNSVRTEGDVARVAVDELSEAFDAEVVFALVTHPRYGERHVLAHTGMTKAGVAALTADPLISEALLAERAQMHSGTDLLEGAPSAALVFDCAARKRALGASLPEEAGALVSAFGDVPALSGLYTRGEVGRTRGAKGDRNHAAVVVAFA